MRNKRNHRNQQTLTEKSQGRFARSFQGRLGTWQCLFSACEPRPKTCGARNPTCSIDSSQFANSLVGRRGRLSLMTLVILAAVSELAAHAQDSDRTPHLCIDTGGHTAPIQVLAFTHDSRFLCSAGLDKAVRVWGVPEMAELTRGDRARAVVREDEERDVSVLRWEVGRGQRGNIHALALSPNGTLALGGYGARGATGDLAWIQLETGEWGGARYEHRQPITGLAWTDDGRWLVSLDRGGTTMVGTDARQTPRVIRRSDEELHGPNAARLIAERIRYRPLALVGRQAVLLPRYAGQSAAGVLQWQLQQLDLKNGQGGRDVTETHYGSILALATSSDGRWCASADEAKQLYLHDLSQPALPARKLGESRVILSLAFSPDGQTLVAGSAAAEGESELQVWDVARRELSRSVRLTEPVYACAISPDGRKLAYVGGPGHDVHWEELAKPDSRVTFAGGRQIAEVSVAPAGDAAHAIVFREAPGAPELSAVRIFDPALLDLRDAVRLPPVDATQWGDWSAELDFVNNRIALTRAGRSLGHVELDRAAHGLLSCCAWIPDERGEAAALAVGTNIQNGVFVFEVSARGAGRLLRYFRGHHDSVLSLCVTRDRRYLVSGARDGLLIYWRLEGVFEEATAPSRWGARLELRGSQTIVTALDDLGPLYQKGVREGDVIDAILWVEGGQTRQQRDPAAIPRELERLPWDRQVAFLTRRNGQERTPFNLFGAWYPLLSVFVTQRDWIAWASSGYYACSAGGERLVGWQLNNALGQPPSFYSAERFSKTLYRPEVVRALLPAGSLRRALARRDESATEVAEIRPPRVRITTPAQRLFEAQARQVDVTAVATAVAESPVESLTLLLNGRPFERKQLGAARFERIGDRDVRATWTLELDPGEHRVGVRADDARTHGTDEIVVRCNAVGERKSTLRVLAVGISNYPGDLKLEFGRSDAETFAETLKQQSRGLFHEVEARTLTDDAATRAGILDGLSWLEKNTLWPDVAVLYVSGHGINDEAGRLFVLPRDGNAKELEKTAIAEDELKRFCASTRGKILVLLDACHAGGLQINVNDLARELGRNDYGVIVMSSSRGDEVAWEDRRWGGGAFTKALVDGLNGAADLRKKGYVLTPVDLDPYVYYTVLELTRGRQTPISNKSPVAPFPITRSRLKTGTPPTPRE